MVARIYTQRANPFTISHIGGVCTNCFNDDGHIHVVCNSHRMSPGRLELEFTAELPDSIYPDDFRCEVTPEALDIELVKGKGWTVAAAN